MTGVCEEKLLVATGFYNDKYMNTAFITEVNTARAGICISHHFSENALAELAKYHNSIKCLCMKPILLYPLVCPGKYM